MIRYQGKKQTITEYSIREYKYYQQMKVYIKRNIYFNTVVSQYFDVPFNNEGEILTLSAWSILKCSVVSWDIDTRNMLEKLENNELTLIGMGSGNWEVDSYSIQDKPKSDYNNDEVEYPQKESGRSAARDLGDFIKSVNNLLFI